jgi:hypothetical protein
MIIIREASKRSAEFRTGSRRRWQGDPDQSRKSMNKSNSRVRDSIEYLGRVPAEKGGVEMPINYPNLIIIAIDAETSRLRQVRNLLAGTNSTGTRRGERKRKRKLSAEGRARISAAQKKRWAKQKREGKR